jgi:RNA-directed DNA polymerase
VLAEHLRGMGVEWKPSQTRITHTLPVEGGEAGFDCLGFNMRPYPTKSTRGDKTIIKASREAMARQQRQMGAVVRRHRMDAQARLIAALNPMLRGWRHDVSTVCRHETFEPMDEQLRQQRRSWIRCRHPNKRLTWGDQKYWRCEDGPRHCRPRARGKRWGFPSETPMQRHVNVHGRRSPDDGDAVDWGRRRVHHPGVSTRVARLLQRPDGRCTACGSAFKAGDVLAVDHLIPRTQGGRDDSTTWQLLHRYGHMEKTARERRGCA